MKKKVEVKVTGPDYYKGDPLKDAIDMMEKQEEGTPKRKMEQNHHGHD